MKAVVLNDTHCGARNSSELFLSYQQRFYEEVLFPYMEEHNIRKIIHLGDYYEHRKYVNFKALNHNRKVFLNELRRRKIHMYIIPGNHDVFYKNTNELCSLKELLGYYTDCVTILMDPTTINIGGLDLAMVPWINHENYDETMEFLQNTPAAIVCGHFEFAGFEMNKGVIQSHGMGTDALQRFEHVYSGHYHTKSSDGHITYLGAQMQFNWSDVDDPKYFHILDTETREIHPVENPITLFERIVYDDRQDPEQYLDIDPGRLSNKFVKIVVRAKKNTHVFDAMVDRITKANPHELKIAETFSEFVGDSVEDTDEDIDMEDTPVLIDTYIDSADTELHKPRLKTLMKDLHVEAQNLEIVE